MNHIGHINPFRYRSYYYDEETGLYYLNSRYYNPVWGRFLNMDSYGGEIGGVALSHNTYCYALNNPVINSDDNGDFAITLPVIVKGVIGFIAAVTTYYVAKELVSVAVPALTGAFSSPTKYDLEDKVKEKEKSKQNVKPIAPYAPKYEDKYPCTTAEINKITHDVDRGERLDILASINYVQLGGNVMCDTIFDAKMVANGFPNSIGPEIDKNQKPGYVYYYHFHPDRTSHRHIWFYTR